VLYQGDTEMTDIRDTLFATISERKYRAVLTPERDGILSGVDDAMKAAAELGVIWQSTYKEGDALKTGIPFAALIAYPKEIAEAEEKIIGTLAKASGIATAARLAVTVAAGKVEIISGSWKKMPPCLKMQVRRAVITGGAQFRICEPPMLYIDKNFVRMLGSVAEALRAASAIQDTQKIVQLRGELASIAEETRQAIQGGANILMVDTGRVKDAQECLQELEARHCRQQVKVAFAGNVHIADISAMIKLGIDKLCIGKDIVDAGLLDMKLDVVEETK